MRMQFQTTKTLLSLKLWLLCESERVESLTAFSVIPQYNLLLNLHMKWQDGILNWTLNGRTFKPRALKLDLLNPSPKDESQKDALYTDINGQSWGTSLWWSLSVGSWCTLLLDMVRESMTPSWSFLSENSRDWNRRTDLWLLAITE